VLVLQFHSSEFFSLIDLIRLAASYRPPAAKFWRPCL
jgi:hypothetical protein